MSTPTAAPEAVAAISAAAIQKRSALFRDALTPENMALFDLIMNELIGLLKVGTEYHENIRERALLMETQDRISPDVAEEWRGHARHMGREAEDLRRILASFQQIRPLLKEAHNPKSLTVLRLFDVWTEQTEELADRIEDLAETMALAVHEPFRNLVEDRLREAGVG